MDSKGKQNVQSLSQKQIVSMCACCRQRRECETYFSCKPRVIHYLQVELCSQILVLDIRLKISEPVHEQFGIFPPTSVSEQFWSTGDKAERQFSICDWSISQTP